MIWVHWYTKKYSEAAGPVRKENINGVANGWDRTAHRGT